MLEESNNRMLTVMAIVIALCVLIIGVKLFGFELFVGVVALLSTIALLVTILYGIHVLFDLKKEREVMRTFIAPLFLYDTILHEYPEELLEDEEILQELKKLASKEELILESLTDKTKNHMEVIALVLLRQRYQKLDELNAPKTEYFDLSTLDSDLSKIHYKRYSTDVLSKRYDISYINKRLEMKEGFYNLEWYTLANKVSAMIYSEVLYNKLEQTNELLKLIGLEATDDIPKMIQELTLEYVDEILTNYKAQFTKESAYLNDSDSEISKLNTIIDLE